MEQKYQEYFAPARTAPSLYKEGQHPAFRTFEEKNMSNYWGFFKLPQSDEQITSADDITCQYCSGDAIYSLAHLLDLSLELVFENLADSKGESFRLGFFKMFPDRIAHRPYDAYLHLLNGGSRLALEVSHPDLVLGSEQVFFRLVRDLCRYLSDDLAWSKHFVGLTISMGKADKLSIEIWTGPLMNFIELRGLRSHLMAFRSGASVEESFEGFCVTVADPETIDADEDKSKEVSALFLAPITPLPTSVSTPLNEEWFALASKFPFGPNGCFENARLLSRSSSLLKTTADLDRIHSERLAAFPGVLAKSTYTILYRKSALPEEAIQLISSGAQFNISHYPAIHKAFSVTISDCSTFTGYVEIFRQCAMYFTTAEHSIVQAAFFHFQSNELNAKGSKLVIELWVPAGTPKNTQNHIQKSVMSYLMANLEI